MNERTPYHHEPENLLGQVSFEGNEFYYTEDGKYKYPKDPAAEKRMKSGVVEYPDGPASCEWQREKAQNLVDLGIEILGRELSPLDFLLEIQHMTRPAELDAAWRRMSGQSDVQNILYLYTKSR